MKGGSEFTGGLADVPLVYIDCGHAANGGETDGVESAGYGFLPVKFAVAIGGINGAKGTGTLMLGKDTVFPIDDLCDEFPLLVWVNNTFFFDLLL